MVSKPTLVAGQAMGSEIANLFEDLQAGQMLVADEKKELANFGYCLSSLY